MSSGCVDPHRHRCNEADTMARHGLESGACITGRDLRPVENAESGAAFWLAWGLLCGAMIDHCAARALSSPVPAP